jgi:hypothetical protein
MYWYHILKADLTTSYRVLIDRIKKHKFTTIFFIFIAIAGTRLVVYFGVYLENLEQGEDPLYIERWVFSIIYFAFIFGKVGLYTYRKVLKEREMLTIFSQPINMHQITMGKFLANFVYISSLLIVGFFLIYGWIIFELGFVGISIDILAEGVLLGVLGLALGFTLPVFLQLQPWYRKAFYLFTNAMIIGIISIPVRFFYPRDLTFFSILIISTLVSLGLVFYSSRFLIEAWTAQLSKPLSQLLSDDYDRLNVETTSEKIIPKNAWLIAKKEIILLIREKDAIVTMVAALFLTIASVAIYYYYGPEGLTGSTMGRFLYPGILAVFLFLGALMISALIGLAMISVEGRAFYIIKSLPITNINVLKGKSIALLIIGFPVIMPMTVVLPIIARFPIWVTFFYVCLGIVLIISFTGIGIWGATRFPNFDPTARNMPDLISQFFIMSVCIICTLFLAVIPAYFMTQYYLVGLVAILIAIGWAITIFILALDRCVVGYDEIGSDFYM